MTKAPGAVPTVHQRPLHSQRPLNIAPRCIVGYCSPTVARRPQNRGVPVKKTTELLAIAKARHDDASDYRLAQLLGVPPQTVSSYRVGRSLPANPIAARLAELCDLDPAAVICWVNIERAQSDDDRRTWHLMLSRVQRSRPARLAA